MGKKWRKVAANNSLIFDFFNSLAFGGPWPLKGSKDLLAEKAGARQEGWPGGGRAGRGAGPAAGRGPRLSLQPLLAAVVFVANTNRTNNFGHDPNYGCWLKSR